MTRKKALEVLKENEYTHNKKLLNEDINIFIKKLGITRKEFDKIMNDGIIRKHEEFKNFNNKTRFFSKIKHLFFK